MTVIGALSSFRELGEMSPHKRASKNRCTAEDKPTHRYRSALFPRSPFPDTFWTTDTLAGQVPTHNTRGSFIFLSPQLGQG